MKQFLRDYLCLLTICITLVIITREFTRAMVACQAIHSGFNVGMKQIK